MKNELDLGTDVSQIKHWIPKGITMRTDAQWWYMQELKRKTRSAEAELAELKRRLDRVEDEPSKLRIKRELDFIEIRLNKFKRGLLY